MPSTQDVTIAKYMFAVAMITLVFTSIKYELFSILSKTCVNIYIRNLI